MLTYQDYLTAADKAAFCVSLITEHKASLSYQVALDADTYDRQRNSTINEFVQKLFSSTGREAVNFTAANNKIASNFFRRLNVQRNTYSLGNGVSFSDTKTKDKLGGSFDTTLSKAGYKALIHGVSFLFWNVDRAHVFALTEFAPLWDENTGALMAGVRFWRLADDKPLFAVLFEVDGYTKFRTDSEGNNLKVIEEKRAYKLKVSVTAADGEEIIGGDNYSALPIVPLWGSELRQSTLVGMKQSIDSYDIIRSGFANDLTDCAQIYWIIKNAGGMTEHDLDTLRTRMIMTHMITVDSDNGATVEAKEQQIPFEARQACLTGLRAGIYEGFGGLDVTSISASAKTATEINAAYQPLDENADDFEYQVIECVQRLLALQGIDDTPIFKRNRISNQLEQVQMVIMEAPYLDDETVLSKLPNITQDEVAAILAKKDAEDSRRLIAEEE